jgi:hypothetical protein
MVKTRYELIKDLGYRIDTRGTQFTLIKGIKARSFATEDEAIDAALREHRELVEKGV